MGIIAFKMMLCGDKDVGKTTLRIRYTGLDIDPTSAMVPGIGFSFRITTISTGEYTGKRIICQIWQPAAEKRFSKIREVYYTCAQGALLVYDCTQPTTFKNIPRWVDEILINVREPIPMVLVSNKSDLLRTTDQIVSSEQGNQLAKRISTKYLNNKFFVPYIETSAKTGQNVDYAFESLIEKIVYKLLSQ